MSVSRDSRAILSTSQRVHRLRGLPLVMLASILAGCAGGASSTEGEAAASATTEEVIAPADSVICDFFAQGGPGDDLTDAAIADIRGENSARPTREAIDGIEALADRADGEEQEDLLAFGNALDDAAISGEGFVGWTDAHNAFLVKYAEGCGVELAN